MSKEVPNYEEITNMKVKEALDGQKKEFDKVQEQTYKDMAYKIDKAIQLQIQLDEVKDAYK